MSLEPLLQAPPVIQIHAWSAMAAFLLGLAILVGRKGNRLHKMAGRAWTVLMLTVCLSSLLIHEIRLWGPWSPIHVLSLATPVALAHGLVSIRRGHVSAHKWSMQASFTGGLVVAGLFSMLPGRLMHAVMRPDQLSGLAWLCLPLAFGLWIWVKRHGLVLGPAAAPNSDRSATTVQTDRVRG